MATAVPVIVLYVPLLVLLMLSLSLQGEVRMSHEKRLIRDLIGNYSARGKMGRPVENQNDTITISYGMSLIQIMDLDERNQILSINVWATYTWNDMYLRWNVTEYGGITTVRVNNDDIWKPDLKLYNYADARLEELRDALCVITSDGNVVWIPQAVFKSSCSIDIRHFPFDVQTCHLKFGSWTYDGANLDLELHYKDVEGFEMSDYIVSNEWDIVTTKATKNVHNYPCCPVPYVDLVFSLKIKRKVAFYNYILILPCVLLSSLTLVLFWLPPESPAKMQLGMNIFVAFFVLLLLLAESTPPAASSIPLIGAYYCLNMVLITLSTLLSVVIVNLYFHGPGTKVPRLFKMVMLDIFATIFCMRNSLLDPKERNDRQFHFRRSKATSAVNANNMTNSTSNGGNMKIKNDQKHFDFKYDRVGIFEMQPEENWRAPNHDTVSDVEMPERVGNLPPQYHQLDSEVREIKRLLKHIVEKGSEKAHKEYLAREWKLVALVLDRLFFFVYLMAIIVSAFALFETTLVAIDDGMGDENAANGSSS